ncbi:hypothetical protein [Lysobacter sp. D1-1-M9]|uniref:hypothetical protein n=1 Tax=Novilysobacter longmucuonensis TaxID=3098603 RepID=UPI002FC7D700
MQIEPKVLALLIGAPLVGAALIFYAARRKPEWKKPVAWALSGIICFELLQQILGLVYS